MAQTVTPLPEGYGLTQCGDLQLPFNTNTTWTKTRGFIVDTHEGIDWATCTGTPVRAMAAGRVVKVEYGHTISHNRSRPRGIPSHGNYVIVHSGGFGDEPLVGFEHVYAHLAEVHVCAGQPVEAGDLLGVSGDTGYSTGPHLHVEVRPFGTQAATTANPHGKTEWNGLTTEWEGHALYSGCVDFEDFLPENAVQQTGTCPFVKVKTGKTVALMQHPSDSASPVTDADGNNIALPDSYSYEYFDKDGSEHTRNVDRYYIIGQSEYFPSRQGNIGPYGVTFWWQIVARGKGIGWVENDTDLLTATDPDNRAHLTWPRPHGHKESHVAPQGLSTRRKAAATTIGIRRSPDKSSRKEGDLTDRYWRSILNWACNYDTRLAWYQIRLGIGNNSPQWVRFDEVDVRQVSTPYVVPVLPLIDVYADTATNSNELGTIADFTPRSTNGQRTNSPTWWRIPYGNGHGWVRNRDIQTAGDVSGVPVIPATGAPPVSTTVRYLRLRSWVTGLFLRTGPAQAFPAYRLLTDTSVWYEVVGQSATTPVWYKIQYDATFQGWVHSSYIELTERTIVIPAVTSPAMPADPAPGGGSSPEAVTTSGSAAGDYRNLVTNPDGRWAVWKSGTRVTANFSSPRSPVQYYARQNPQPQFVVPEGFRPTSTVTREVTGTRVNEDRTPVPDAPPAPFTLRFETDGEMRYVNNSQVDHLGYVSYQVTHLEWDTDEELVVTDQPGTLSGNGTFINQQNHVGSSWTLTRSRGGTRVTGTISCTRSPVDNYANGNPGRDSVLVLPEDFRPASDVSITVEDAVRVNMDGSDSTDRRRVDFDMTMQSDGYMWYDRDTSLTTAGVGYLRYSVDVSWDARPLVPTAPRNLETDDVEADEVELDWDRPQYDGGDAVDEYRVEVYRNGRWEVVEDGISRTRYDVEDLEPYTTYDFRVRAHNRADWSEPSTAVTVTTPRETPGRPRSLQASATHERVTLTWSAPSGDVTVSGYRIERRVGSGSWRTRVYDTGETATGWEDTDVSASTSYSYQVRAHNHGVDGAWSSARSVTTAAEPTIPGQPTGLTVSPGMDSRLQLSWTAPSDTGGGLTGYRIERSPDETPRVWTDVATDTVSADLTWDEHDVVADTVYHYQVSARNSAGVGMASAEAEGRTRPQLQLAVTATYPLAAHAEPRVDSAVTAIFHLYEEDRTLDLVGQVPGNNGWWRVLLFGQAAQGPFWLPAVAGTVSGNTSALPQPPSSPESFTAALASGQVTLSWAAPASGSAVTGYRLWRQEGDGAFAQLGSDLAATVTTYTDSAVQNDHVYRYWLQALSDEGPGVPTTTLALAVMAVPVVPAAVTDLTVAATAYTLQLGWMRNATGGLPTGYRVAWGPAGTTPLTEITVIGTGHELTDLDPDTAYDLQVTAFNQEGDAPVTSHTASTLTAVPGEPTGLTAQPTVDSQMTLAWGGAGVSGGAAAGGVPDRTGGGQSDPGLAGRGGRHRQHGPDLVGQRSGCGHDLPLPGQCPQRRGRGRCLGRHRRHHAPAGGVGGRGELSAGGAPMAGGDGAGDPQLAAARCGRETGHRGPGRRRELVPGAALRAEGVRALLAAGRGRRCDGGHGGPAADAGGTDGPGGRAVGGQPDGVDLDGAGHGRRRDGLPHRALAGRGSVGMDGACVGYGHAGHRLVGRRPGRGHGVPLPGNGAQRRGVGRALGIDRRHHAPAVEPQGHHHARSQRALRTGYVPWHRGLDRRGLHHPLRHPGQGCRDGRLVPDPLQQHRDRLGARGLCPDPRRPCRSGRDLDPRPATEPQSHHHVRSQRALRTGYVPRHRGLDRWGSTTRYDILGKDAATPVWWQIQFSSTVTGWVHGDYVQTHGDLGGVPIR